MTTTLYYGLLSLYASSSLYDSRNLSFNLLAPESWESASILVVSQTDAFDSGGSCESKYMIKLISTGILEVCEWSDSVADRRFRLGRVLGVKIYAKTNWHRYPGSLRVV